MSETGAAILLVEDDPDFAAALSLSLHGAGYMVRTARSAEEALRLARLDPPDLAIMDIMMGERTEGFFAIHELRRLPGLEGLPIIVVSAIYDSGEDFEVPPDRSWLAHDAFFSKPVDSSELLARIAELLAGAKAERPAAESRSGS